jgi:Ras and EF-hand domain-containing protein
VAGNFCPGIPATIGVDFAIKTGSRDGVPVTLQLWDIAGQEHSRNMTRTFYRYGVGALVVADITDPQTLKAAELWKQDLDTKVFIPGTRQPVPALLLLNKCDLGRCELTDEQLDDWCAKHGFKGWLAVSALDGTNVNEAFEQMITLMIATKTLAGKTIAPAPAPSVIVKPIAMHPAATRKCFLSRVAAAVRKRCFCGF